MKTIAAVAITLVTLGTGTLEAADRPPLYNPWGGFYLGAQVGYTWGHDSTIGTNLAPGGTSSLVPGHIDTGALGGAHAGYDLVFQQKLLFGLRLDVSGSAMQGANRAHNNAGVDDRALRTDVNHLELLRGRVGMAFDKLLVYGSAGAAWMTADTTRVQLVGTVNFASPGTVEKIRYESTGYAGGVGFEYAIAPHWNVGAEYIYVSVEGRHVRPLALILGVEDIRFHTTQLNATYRF